ncbi:Hypothetical predicted protein [Olea europaea subsp. europaea]|uniref:Uncharacterized protein n=1 Tax=Olea europaea subsp. europaea TaxID=158383 RepID=A0A8S0PRD3_OLEEU|nr:Hypothetical predicted protein [Olea europaea subsp. europaea]
MVNHACLYSCNICGPLSNSIQVTEFTTAMPKCSRFLRITSHLWIGCNNGDHQLSFCQILVNTQI